MPTRFQCVLVLPVAMLALSSAVSSLVLIAVIAVSVEPLILSIGYAGMKQDELPIDAIGLVVWVSCAPLGFLLSTRFLVSGFRRAAIESRLRAWGIDLGVAGAACVVTCIALRGFRVPLYVFEPLRPTVDVLFRVGPCLLIALGVLSIVRKQRRQGNVVGHPQFRGESSGSTRRRTDKAVRKDSPSR
jgi:hypothetical protein